MAVAALGMAAGCTNGASEPPEVGAVAPQPETLPALVPEPAPVAGDIPPGFEAWYNQPLNWAPCDESFECATVSAPLDWSDPGAGAIELALKMRPATGEKIGSLLINPGGPGGSGVDFIEWSVFRFGQPVQESFDVIGFDPRGVGQSSAVVCLDDAGKDEFLSQDFSDDEAGRLAAAEANAAWGAACAANTGPLFGHIDTGSAARDMDLIRHLVGDPALNYLGFSYGTQLGAAYAGLFPGNVGRLVLDGAIDITLGADETNLGQATGFEHALRAYVNFCQTQPMCPLTGGLPGGLDQIRAVLDQALTSPLPTYGERSVTRTLVFYGLAMALYDEGTWPLLTVALDQAINEGRGDMLLFLADFYNNRNDDGSFSSNITEAFIGIGCLDSRGTEDWAEMDALAEELLAAAPTLGSFFTHAGIGCWQWPHPVVPVDYDIHAPGTPPILVIGTTGDPATPFAWSQALAETLDSGVLLTYVGEGHTAYSRSNDCVLNTVDDFLVNGVVPPPNTTC